jgi:hypothetical protein
MSGRPVPEPEPPLPEPSFDYSAGEWSVIERAAPPARDYPQLTVLDLRWDLRLSAEMFQQQRLEGNHGKQKSMELKRKELWKRLARLSGEAKSVLSELRNGDVSLQIAKHPQRPRVGQIIIRSPLSLGSLGVRSGVRNAEQDGMLAMMHNELPPECFAVLTRHVAAKVRYQSQVLQAWLFLGGELKHSTNCGVVDGPLWRFFAAVAKPVMGKEMPKRSGFPDIVDREKRRIAALSAGGLSMWTIGGGFLRTIMGI